MSKKKTNNLIDRDVEIQGAKAFGKHVSEEKGRLLLIVTLLASAAPAVMGLRLWNEIPALYETGIITANGQDDSLPRWAIVLVIPALMCLLNFLCHHRLRVSQQQMVLPKVYFRLVGRWGIPIVSVLFAGGLIREAASLTPLPMTYLTPAALGLIMMILGAQMYDCKENAVFSLPYAFLRGDPTLHRAVHRFAAHVWLAVGLIAVLAAQLGEMAGMLACFAALLSLLAPWLYGRSRAAKHL